MTGPVLVDAARPGLVGELGDLWLAVTRAGGAVGFVADSPETDVRAAAAAAVAELHAGTSQMIALIEPVLVGCVFLVPHAGVVVRHRATVVRLMVRPDAGRRGRGGLLLTAAVHRARELGLEQLMLFVRGGEGLEPFYTAHGWREVGRWPGGLRVGGERRDDVWFARDVP